MRYTLVRYKESGEDTCRGCVMDSWNSEFEILHFTEHRDLIKFYGEMLFNDDISSKNRRGRSDYNILINGIDLLDSYNGFEDSYGLFYKLHDKARAIADAKHKAIEDKRLEAARIERERKEVERQEQQRKAAIQELELYNKLKEKYGE